MGAVATTQTSYSERYRAKVVEMSEALKTLQSEADRLSTLTAGHDRSEVERQLKEKADDIMKLNTFDNDLVTVTGFDVAVKEVTAKRAEKKAAAIAEGQGQ